MNQVIDHFRQNKKDLIGLVFIILLIIAIPLSFILVKQTQIFKSRASSNVFQVIQTQEAEIKYENSSKIETTSPSIDIELTSPIDNEGKQSDSGWIKTAYAASDPENIEPVNGASFTLVNAEDGVTFKWKGDADLKRYNLVIYRGTHNNEVLGRPVIVAECESERKGLIFCKTNITDTSLKVKRDFFDKGPMQYSWYVQGYDGNNKVVGSQGTFFTVATPTESTSSCEYLKYKRYDTVTEKPLDGVEIKASTTPIEVKVDSHIVFYSFDVENRALNLVQREVRWEKTGGTIIFVSNLPVGISWKSADTKDIGKQFSLDLYIDNKKQDKCSARIKLVAADSGSGAGVQEQVSNNVPASDAKLDKAANEDIRFYWDGIRDVTKYRLLIAYTNPAKNSGKDSENDKYDVCKPDRFDPQGWAGYYLCKEVNGTFTDIPVARLTDKAEYNWWVDPIGADGKKKGLLGADGKKKGLQSDGTKFTLDIKAGPTPKATPKSTATATPKASSTPTATPVTKKPQDDPKYCAGYYQRCGANLEGTQWCEGGYKLTNGACGWDDGHPTYVSGCYKTREDVTKGTNKNGCNIAASAAAPQPGGAANQPAGRDGAAPVSTIDYKSPGSLHGDKVVTLCGKDLTLDQLREELRGAGYNGLYDEPSATAAYLKTACPKSQNNCNPFPDTGDAPEGYIWVADCSAAGECLRNNSTGNDKNLCIDPKQGDPAACPKNYNDPYVNPATSNWCFGFANGNKCLMLWSKNYNENRKDVVAKGGGTPNAAMCPTGTTATPARPTATPIATPRPTGNVGVGTTTPQTTPPLRPASNGWLKAACTSNVFAGCSLPRGKVCSDWGANSEAYKSAGWSEDEYKKCQSACRVYEDGKNSPAACTALGVLSPAVNKTISGKIEKQVKEGATCSLQPVSGIVVSLVEGGTGVREDFATDSNGRFNFKIPEGKEYAVRILDQPNLDDKQKWDKRAYENQKQGARNDCDSSCNFVRLEDGCSQVGVQARLAEQAVTSEYRVSQDRVAFNDPEALWQTYTQGGVKVRQIFNSPGQHFVFVQFRDSDKNIISPTGGDGIYILTVNYKLKTADATSGGAPTQQPVAQPTAPGTPCTSPSQPGGLTYDPSSKTVSWNPVSGVSEYNLRVVTPHKGQRNFDGIKNTWYTMPSEDVSASGGYSWWLDAVNSCGTGRSSSSFTVGGAAPAGGGGWVCSNDDYGDYAGGKVTKQQWCDCAASHKPQPDYGSLANGPDGKACSGYATPAPAQQASCNDRSVFPLKETCGNMTYSGRCDADVVCSQSGATADTLFTCIGDDSYRCTGQYRCGTCAGSN